MLKRFGFAVAAALAATAPAWAEDKQPVTQKTNTELLSFYKSLPFTDVGQRRVHVALSSLV